MFEYVATLVGMQQVDEVLLAKAQAKETNRAQIVQTAPLNICSYADDMKIKECLKAKFKILEKTPDPYDELWDRDWVKKP